MLRRSASICTIKFFVPSSIIGLVQLYRENTDVAYEAKSHWIYDRYHWTPDIVNNMSIDEVNKHYELIITVIKEESAQRSELIGSLVKHANKLFKTYLGR